MDSYQRTQTQTTDVDEETDSPVKEAKSTLIAEDTVVVLSDAGKIMIKEKILEILWYVYSLI